MKHARVLLVLAGLATSGACTSIIGDFTLPDGGSCSNGMDPCSRCLEKMCCSKLQACGNDPTCTACLASESETCPSNGPFTVLESCELACADDCSQSSSSSSTGS